jgi:hypothetical protein
MRKYMANNVSCSITWGLGGLLLWRLPVGVATVPGLLKARNRSCQCLCLLVQWYIFVFLSKQKKGSDVGERCRSAGGIGEDV